MPRIHNLDVRSNEMDEVVGNIPPWIIRWGVTTLFGIAILFIVISTIIKFPDTLKCKVIIQAKEQPGKITVSRTDASQHFKFFVKEGDHVKPGDTLLVETDDKTGKHSPIITPMSGKIYISKGVDEQNTLDQFIWVLPVSSNIDIKLKYGNSGAGNVTVGKIVKIELSDFPVNDYGYLEGEISSVMPMQIDGQHLAYVKLKSKKMITSQNKEIQILPVMEGNAEIYLNNKSIFQRIFRSIF